MTPGQQLLTQLPHSRLQNINH